MADPAPLRARADGLLDADGLPAWPLMNASLQGELAPTGELSLGRWCVGEVGRLRIDGLQGPFVIAPGRLAAPGGAGLFVAQTAPAVLVRGARPTMLGHEGGRLLLAQRGEDWLIGVGLDQAEAERGLAVDPDQIVREAEAHVRRCDLLPDADPLLRSLVIQGVHAALSSIRAYPDGSFAGISAGLAYSNPARTYFRDSYWTLPLLYALAPEVVAAQLGLLGAHVQADGEAPSAVIVQGPHANAFEQRRLEELALAAIHWRRGEWWSDHFDSPLFFVLAVCELTAVTGDDTLARTHWPKLRAVFDRYRRLKGADGLPVKPRNDRDWADNVFRSGLVAYDLGLWVGALDVLTELGAAIDPELAEAARGEAAEARAAIERTLWRGDWCVDYLRPDGTAEDHLALDALMPARHGAISEPHAVAMLQAARARLESRRNAEQPYGDFGMLSVWPLFSQASELRAKSGFPFRYHNGGDWPWLDAVYAGERLKRGLDGWRYPLTRWWQWCLDQGWAGAVEHYSEPFGRGSLLQAWSSLPAAMAVRYADRVLAGDPQAAAV